MKTFTCKLLKAVPIVLMGMGSFITSHAEVVTGKAGNNVTFELDKDTKVLTLRGTGATASGGGLLGVFSAQEFKVYNDDIETIIIEGGITSIGARLFQAVDKVKDVYMPCTLTSLGDYIFDDGVGSTYHNYTLHCPEGSWIANNYNNTIFGVHTANSLQLGVRVQTGGTVLRPTYENQGKMVADWNDEEAHDCAWSVTTPAKCLVPGVETEACKTRNCNKVFGTRPLSQHVDALTLVEAHEGHTCLEPNVKEHYKCDVCSSLYMDDAAQNSVQPSDVVTGWKSVTFEFKSEMYDEVNGKYPPYHTDVAGSIQFFLYKPEEVGVNGKISSIAFNVTVPTTTEVNNRVEIYMVETTLKDLSSKPSKASFKKVFAKSDLQLGTKAGWEELVLDEEFSYSGKNNLCIAVVRSGAAYNAAYGYKEYAVTRDDPSRGTSYSGVASRGSWNNYGQGSALNPSRLPDIRFSISQSFEHKFESIAETKPTCVETGIVAHEHCILCGNDYEVKSDSKSDEGLLNNLIEDALGHSYVTYDAAAAVRDADGLYHTECSVCHDGEDSQRYAKVVISKVGYTTIFYGVPLHTEGEGVRSLAITKIAEGEIELTPVENLGESQGFVVQGEANATYWFPEQDLDGDLESQLKGTTVDKACEASKCYVLGVGKNSTKVGFYPFSGTTLGAYKAYLEEDQLESKTGAALANGYRFVIAGDDAETAIEQLAADEADMTLYDLSGRKVTAPVKGQPYIQAGKKVIF